MARVKLTTILRNLRVTKAEFDEAKRWQPRLGKVAKAGKDGKVDKDAVLRELELSEIGGGAPAPVAPRTLADIKTEQAEEQLKQMRAKTALVEKDLARANNQVIECDAMKRVGAGYTSRIVNLLNNAASKLAPLMVACKTEAEAKRILDTHLAGTVQEWSEWDVDKIAADELQARTHRRAGSRSWRTEHKK